MARRLFDLGALPLLVVACVLGSGGLVWRATEAAFTASTSTGANSWTTGNVMLSDDSAASSAFSVAAAAPGASSSRCVQVTFAGNLPSLVRLYTSFAGGLAPYLDVVVEQGSGGSFASCTGFTPSSTVFSGSASAFAASATGFDAGIGTFAPTGAGQSATYRFTVQLDTAVPNARQGDSATGTFTWESRNVSGGAGAVSAYRTPGAALVDLAAVGTTDWVHWGMTGKYAVNRRGGAPVIPTWSEVGTPSTLWYYSDPTTTFTWSGGSPTASPGAPTGYRVYTGDDGNGFRLVLPATAAPRTLHLYLGVFESTGRLTATLSDGSVAHLGSPVTNASGATDIEYVVTFASTTPGATITLDWVQTQSFGSAQVNLQAAALA